MTLFQIKAKREGLVDLKQWVLNHRLPLGRWCYLGKPTMQLWYRRVAAKRPQLEKFAFVTVFSSLTWAKLTQLHVSEREGRDVGSISVVNPLIIYPEFIPIFHSNPEWLLIQSLGVLHNPVEWKEIFAWFLDFPCVCSMLLPQNYIVIMIPSALYLPENFHKLWVANGLCFFLILCWMYFLINISLSVQLNLLGHNEK